MSRKNQLSAVIVSIMMVACSTQTPSLQFTPSELVMSSNPIFVNQQAKGKNNGNNWKDAYASLQVALRDQRLGQSRWEIWVAKGEYASHSQEPFYLKNGVALYGGFSGQEIALQERNPGKNPTILSSPKDSHQRVLVAHTLPKGVRIDGFVIQGGKSQDDGAGLKVIKTPFVLANCIMQNNHTSSHHAGGGISIEGNATITIENTVFKNNSAGSGGALHIMGNKELITIKSSVFTANQALNGPGGAIFLDAQSSGESIKHLKISDSLFSHNESIMALGHAIHGNANSGWDVKPHYSTKGELVNNIFKGSPGEGSLISLSENQSVLLLKDNYVEKLNTTALFAQYPDSTLKLLKGNREQ